MSVCAVTNKRYQAAGCSSSISKSRPSAKMLFEIRIQSSSVGSTLSGSTECSLWMRLDDLDEADAIATDDEMELELVGSSGNWWIGLYWTTKLCISHPCGRHVRIWRVADVEFDKMNSRVLGALGSDCDGGGEKEYPRWKSKIKLHLFSIKVSDKKVIEFNFHGSIILK